MRIEREDGDNVGSVWAVCTRDEAELRLGSLIGYFEQDPPDPGWRHHVGHGDNELTITVELSPNS